MLSESKHIKAAIRTLETIIKGQESLSVPPDYFIKGVEMLEAWKKEIPSNSSKEKEEGDREEL